jgi:pilus assembly protein Flp/PilA
VTGSYPIYLSLGLESGFGANFLRMFSMHKIFNSFLDDTAGATAIEYGLIAALIATVIILALTNLGVSLNTTFTLIDSALSPEVNNP